MRGIYGHFSGDGVKKLVWGWALSGKEEFLRYFKIPDGNGI